jgi:hypothetical protein
VVVAAFILFCITLWLIRSYYKHPERYLWVTWMIDKIAICWTACKNGYYPFKLVRMFTWAGNGPPAPQAQATETRSAAAGHTRAASRSGTAEQDAAEQSAPSSSIEVGAPITIPRCTC